MRTSALPLVLSLLVASPAFAQVDRDSAAVRSIDLGPGVSGYQRFLIYPHLQKGLELLRRGDRDRALTELERARELAPGNATVALYLAEAYRDAGRIDRAESVLRQQLTMTPAEARVRAALSELAPARAAAAPGLRVPSGLPERSKPPAARAIASSRPARPARSRPDSPVAPPPVAVAITPADELRQQFSVALEERRPDDAARAARALLDDAPGAALLDEVTYRLGEAGATEQAARLLLQAYPFDSVTESERHQLLDRLVLLVSENSSDLKDADLASLREPLGAPSLRQRQGALWAALEDCAAVRAVLGDMSSDYGHDDLMRLGDCSSDDAPLQAQRAYERAAALRPGGRASLELAYQAYANGDYAAALAAWRTVAGKPGVEEMSAPHWLAAATTAFDAHDFAQADAWLKDYRAAGGPTDYRYWSLLASVHEARGNAVPAIDALEQATSLAPEIRAYVRLARLTDDVARRVHWLEQATALRGAGADVHLELAYAYQGAGRGADAERALEAAAALDPRQVNVQLELGYSYWSSGKPALAATYLERAWQADAGNLAAALQLVYVYQRLSRSSEARFYAERAIEALSQEPPTADTADRVFGLQRLHEDLGRRLTISVDGWSGTRVGTGTIADAGGRYRSYTQAEVDYRLGSTAIRNGRTVSAYARILADSGETSTPAPTKNPRIGVGVRWKPFTSQVLYVAAEHQRALDGSAYQDVLLRSSASFLNGGRHSDDWHASGKTWTAFNLYLDAAHYLKNDQTAATVDLRSSIHVKVASRQTIEPYVRVQASGFRAQRIDRDLRTGIGSRWNLWHGRSQYNADPGKISLGLEYQRAIQTDLAGRSGVFLSLSSRW